MPGEGLRARRTRARASVLAAIVASATMRMIVAAGSLSRVTIGTSTGVESAACVVVAAETLMHRDSGALHAALWCLVDGRTKGIHWLVSSSHHRDNELSACCAAARSSSV